MVRRVTAGASTAKAADGEGDGDAPRATGEATLAAGDAPVVGEAALATGDGDDVVVAGDACTAGVGDTAAGWPIVGEAAGELPAGAAVAADFVCDGDWDVAC